MNQPIPPLIPTPVRQRKQTVRIVILVFLVCFFMFVLFPIVVATVIGIWTFLEVKEAGEIHYTSYADKFHVTVLELKSEPNYFSERVRIRCERDMKASVWVAELKEAGIFETKAMGGEVYYRDGHPDRIRDSVIARADGGVSSCDILFSIKTTSTNTIWHSWMSATTTRGGGHSGDSGGVDTTLPAPLTVSDVQTNWPGSYERGSEIPLANIGDYKILLSVK